MGKQVYCEAIWHSGILSLLFDGATEQNSFVEKNERQLNNIWLPIPSNMLAIMLASKLFEVGSLPSLGARLAPAPMTAPPMPGIGGGCCWILMDSALLS